MGVFIIRSVPTGVKFDLYAANGQTVLSSEVYKTAAACRKGIQSVRKNAAAANIEDQTAEDSIPLGNPKFELYEDRSGEFRFRLKARNGTIVAVSQGYASKSGCRDGIESVRRNALDAATEEVRIRTL